MTHPYIYRGWSVRYVKGWCATRNGVRIEASSEAALYRLIDQRIRQRDEARALLDGARLR